MQHHGVALPRMCDPEYGKDTMRNEHPHFIRLCALIFLTLAFAVWYLQSLLPQNGVEHQIGPSRSFAVFVKPQIDGVRMVVNHNRERSRKDSHVDVTVLPEGLAWGALVLGTVAAVVDGAIYWLRSSTEGED